MKAKNNVSLAVIFSLLVAFTRAEAQLSYNVTDLGTLGGTTSSANGVAGQQGHNAAGMIVGTSTASDGSDHAFLYTNGKMFDLNTLCDLSQSDFTVLTVAKTISDSCLIIGEGVTNNGQKHAFLLTPLPVDGGQWSYVCCQWVWMQVGGGWWWETGCGCYKWHGPPHGRHPPCPPQPPHCWWWPLPCPPECGCTPPEGPPPPPPPPAPPRTTLPPPPPSIVTLPPPTIQLPPLTRQLPPPTIKPPPNYPNTPPPPPITHVTPTPSIVGVPVGVRPTPTPTPPTTFIPGVVQPTPTPPLTYVPGVLQKPTPKPRRIRKPTPTPPSTLHDNVPGSLLKFPNPKFDVTTTPTPKPQPALRLPSSQHKELSIKQPTPSGKRIPPKSEESTKESTPTPTPYFKDTKTQDPG